MRISVRACNMYTKTSTKWFWCLIIILLTTSTLKAQDSSNIRRKILESEESDQMLVQRTRDFILNKLEIGNISEAYQAYSFAVDQLERDRTLPFLIVEKFVLGYWFGKYETLYDADSIENARDLERKILYIYPQRDKLALELKALSRNNRSELIQRIDSLVDDNEKHDFLVLFFDWLTFDPSEQGMTEQQTQDFLELNLTPRAEEFLAAYKNSPFALFVQRHFRYRYVLNDWGFGYYLGLGSLAPQSTAELYLKPEFTLGMGFDLSRKQFLMNAGFDMGAPVAIRKPFVYEGKTWNTDVRRNYYAFYAAAGWVVEDTRQFKLSPKIGIGGIHLSVCEADQEKPGGDFSMTQAAMQYGIICDIKLGLDDSFFRENIHSYSGLRVSFDYFRFFEGNPIMSGGMLRFNISWIGFSRTINRDV